MYATINASTTLHNKVFKKIIKTTVTFFETTPIGRIQNIFSRDIDEGRIYCFLNCNATVHELLCIINYCICCHADCLYIFASNEQFLKIVCKLFANYL